MTRGRLLRDRLFGGRVLGGLVLGTALLTGVSGCALPGTAVASPPRVPAGASRGGTVRLGVVSPAAIDPLHVSDDSGALISGLLCDTLVSIDPTTGKPVPGLAASYSFSGNLLTLKLRKGLRLANGARLTAQDVAASLSALANPSYASPNSSLLSEVAGYSKLAGNLFADPHAALDGVNAVDSSDLQIALTGDDPGFLLALAQPATAPLAPGTYGAANPSCVGPYQLTRPWHPGATSLQLQRTSGYYDRNVGYTGGGAGYPDTVAISTFSSQAAAQTAFLRGSVDLAPVPATSTATAPTGARVATGAVPTEEYLGLGATESGPLADAGIRRALSMAIDRTRLVSDVWGAGATPATSFLPPAVLTGSTPVTCGTDTPAGGSAAAARAALSAAQLSSLASGSITITVNNDGRLPREAADIAADWRAAFGLSVEVTTEPWSSYVAQATSPTGLSGAFRVSWSGDAAGPRASYPDPAQILGPLFSEADNVLANWAHFADPVFEQDLSNGLLPASIGVDRQQQTQQIDTLLCNEMPIIPLATGQVRWLVRDSLTSARGVVLSREGLPLVRELYQS